MSLWDKKCTPEQAVKRTCCAWLWIHQTRGYCMFWHNLSTGIWDAKRKIYRRNKSRYGRLGIPDLLGSWYGVPLAIEIKTPQVKDLFGKVTQSKGYASDEQKKFLFEANEKGWFAFVAYGVDDLERELIQSEKGKEAKRRWENERRVCEL